MIGVKIGENQAASVLSPDRDINAARKLVNLAASGAQSLGKLGQAGTAVWQQTAAA
jgi:hypothetical protein